MTLRLLLLGDSIAHGTGAARAADALAPRLARALEATGLAVEHRSVAVPGATSAALAAQVARAAAWRPDVAVLVIGANDLTRLRPAGQAAAELAAAVRGLVAGGTQVVVAPAPDLSVVPHVPAELRELVRAGSLALRAAQERAVVLAGGQVVDVHGATSAAFGRDRALFAADRFHPSSAGYAVIAAELAPAVLAAATRTAAA